MLQKVDVSEAHRQKTQHRAAVDAAVIAPHPRALTQATHHTILLLDTQDTPQDTPKDTPNTPKFTLHRPKYMHILALHLDHKPPLHQEVACRNNQVQQQEEEDTYQVHQVEWPTFRPIKIQLFS